MEISYHESDRIISELLQSFNRNSMVLFVGCAAAKEDLTKEVCELPWSCVVTSKREESFGKYFTTDRRTSQYKSVSELPAHLFNRSNLQIIRLYGIDGWHENDPEDEELIKLRQEKNAEKMLSVVMGRLDVLSQMVVIGYDPNLTNEIPRLTFTLA